MIMKKTIFLCLSIIILVTSFTSCSSNSTSNSANNGISDSQYAADMQYSSFRYDSNNELYRGLRDFDINILQEINDVENRYMMDTSNKTHVTENEQKNGIFGNMRNQLLTENTALIPYYRGEEIPYDNKEGFSNITVFTSENYRKPHILYKGQFDSGKINFFIQYYDRNLLDEANEKGASWLISQISPDAVNIYNYKKIFAETEYNDVTVYEKEIQLGDRDVLAMIHDITFEENYRSLSIYFVYDDILVRAVASPETAEFILPDITFREIDFPTNTPLRDEPGREGTKYSKRFEQNTIHTIK